MLERSTFCFPDSVFEPEHVGGPEALPELCARADQATELDHLDEAVEAQVHGPVLLQRDVEAIVLDPCFTGSPVAEAAAACPLSSISPARTRRDACR